jgi:pimeloyl-ACP methyl ester carboxylesterase
MFFVVFFFVAIILVILYSKYVPKPTEDTKNMSQSAKYMKMCDEKGERNEIYHRNFFPGGQDVDLVYGTCRMYLFGPENGERIIFVHGISMASSSFDVVARDVAAAGYRVCVYDLWARGFSDGPGAHYTKTFYVSQLLHLQKYLGWEKSSICGLSLGGAIATAFTAKFPERVERLILVAPAGLIEVNFIKS